jgi:hypothetical protein
MRGSQQDDYMSWARIFVPATNTRSTRNEYTGLPGRSLDAWDRRRIGGHQSCHGGKDSRGEPELQNPIDHE